MERSETMSRLGAILSFAWIAAPKVMGGACLILLNVYLISHMRRDLFAIYSLCLAMLTLLSEGVFGSAIDMAVLKLSPLTLEEDPQKSLGIERAALRIKLTVIGVLSAALVVASVPLSQFLFHRAGYAYLIGIVGMAACISVALASAMLHLQIRAQFLRYGGFDWLHLATKYVGIAAVLYAFSTANAPVPPLGILIWFALAPLLALLFFACVYGTSLFQANDTVRWRTVVLSQAKWMLATLAVSALIAKLDVFLLTAWSTIDEVGLYSGGQSLAIVPLMVGTYLAIVLNPRVMPAWKAGRFFVLLRDVQLTLLVFAVLGYAGIYCFQGPITAWLLPRDFAASKDIFLVLLPMTLAGMLSYPLTIAFLMYVRPRLLLQMECWLLIPTVLAYRYAIPGHGAMGAAVVTTVMGILKTIIAQAFAFYWAARPPEELGLPVGLDDR